MLRGPSCKAQACSHPVNDTDGLEVSLRKFSELVLLPGHSRDAGMFCQRMN